MKKILFALSFVIASFAASAQAIIPFVGGNMSGYMSKGNNNRYTPVAGLNAGVLGDIRLSSLFSLQSGLHYMLIGGNVNYPMSLYSNRAPATKDQLRMRALQLPIMLVIKTGAEDAGRFFAGAGFYVTAILGGSMSRDYAEIYVNTGNYIMHHEETKLGFNSVKTPSPIDFGLNVGAGYQLEKGLEFYAFYQKGSEDFLLDYQGKNSRTYQYGLSIRYALKLRKQKTGPQKAGG